MAKLRTNHYKVTVIYNDGSKLSLTGRIEKILTEQMTEVEISEYIVEKSQVGHDSDTGKNKIVESVRKGRANFKLFKYAR